MCGGWAREVTGTEGYEGWKDEVAGIFRVELAEDGSIVIRPEGRVEQAPRKAAVGAAVAEDALSESDSPH